MKKILLASLMAGAFLTPFLASKPALADYCREYTKTIHVAGKTQTGYGTACMQPDGSWLIVDAQGSVDPFGALRNDNEVVVAQQPVYFDYGPDLRPVRYNPAPQIVIGVGGWHRHGWDRGPYHPWTYGPYHHRHY